MVVEADGKSMEVQKVCKLFLSGRGRKAVPIASGAECGKGKVVAGGNGKVPFLCRQVCMEMTDEMTETDRPVGDHA